MSVSASTQIPKTFDAVVFRRQCKVLFEHVLHDPHVEEFSASGQAREVSTSSDDAAIARLIIGSAFNAS
jgi:hypothetical protein